MRPGGPELLIGMTLSGRYLIERLIGEGGMGAVYQAEHTHMRKRLAVKVLHPEMSRLPEVVARFEREAMAAAHIDHPNVAAATDFGKLEDGSFFLVLEYVEGRSLRDVIADGPLELGRAIHVARQIASALGRAHALGIVHRDLKPENVMLVTRDGDPDFAKVLDFGIAKVPIGAIAGDTTQPGPALTQLGMVYGTPEYMAPEQALGQEVDARADLYALGAIMFEMIAGTRPFEHESKVTLLGMHVTAPIPKMAERAPAANVPPVIEGIVSRLLAKEASARFADSKDLVDALDDAAHDLAATGRIPEPSQPASRGQHGPPSTHRSNGDLKSSAALALGPTSLAQPAVASRGWLGSLVGSSRAALERALRSAPPWKKPTRVVIAGAVFASLLLVVLVGPSSHRGSVDGAAPHASGSTAEPARPADPPTDEIVAAARGASEDRQGRLRDRHRRADGAREGGAGPRRRARAARARLHERSQLARGDARGRPVAPGGSERERRRQARGRRAQRRALQGGARRRIHPARIADGPARDRHPLRHRVRRLGTPVSASGRAGTPFARRRRRSRPGEPRPRGPPRLPRR